MSVFASNDYNITGEDALCFQASDCVALSGSSSFGRKGVSCGWARPTSNVPCPWTKLVRARCDGFVKALRPHSSSLTCDQVKPLKSNAQLGVCVAQAGGGGRGAADGDGHAEPHGEPRARLQALHALRVDPAAPGRLGCRRQGLSELRQVKSSLFFPHEK